MSKQSKRMRRALAKAAFKRRDPNVVLLKNASHYHWMGDFTKAGAIFFPLMAKIIVEPLKGTEEYRDGERKPDIPLEEQQEEIEDEDEDRNNVVTFDTLFGRERTEGEYDDETDRDDQGYLIR